MKRWELTPDVGGLWPTRRVWTETQAARAGASARAWWRGLCAVLPIWLLSRVIFYLAAFFGSALLPAAGSFRGRVDVEAPLALAMHWRWDAMHYLAIASAGYGPDAALLSTGESGPNPLPAFFPLLPLLTRFTAATLQFLEPLAPFLLANREQSLLLAGVVVAQAATLLAFTLLFRLVREETRDGATAERAVLYLAIFPLAFYYGVPYAEPLFLACSIGALFAARRGQWVRAGLWAAAASATRPFGMLLLPALALEILLTWRRRGLEKGAWQRALLGLCLAPLGLLLFMLHLWRRVGDPLAFVHAQKEVWFRESVFPLTTLWRGIGYALHPTWSNAPDTYARTVLHTLIVVLFLLVLVASFRHWRPAYVLYGLLYVTMVLSSPWPGHTLMHSLGRSIMVLFPVYITLAHWGRRPAVNLAIIMLFLPLQALLTALYVQWHFVA